MTPAADGGRGPAWWPRVAVAAVAVVPAVLLAWFGLLYLVFGFTGADPHRLWRIGALPVVYAAALAWTLAGSDRPAQALRRACRLGIGTAFCLPVAAVAVLLVWQASPERPDLGMGGLMLYAMPVVAFVAAALLVPLFWFGMRAAERRIGGGGGDAPGR